MNNFEMVVYTVMKDGSKHRRWFVVPAIDLRAAIRLCIEIADAELNCERAIIAGWKQV